MRLDLGLLRDVLLVGSLAALIVSVRYETGKAGVCRAVGLALLDAAFLVVNW